MKDKGNLSLANALKDLMGSLMYGQLTESSKPRGDIYGENNMELE